MRKPGKGFRMFPSGLHTPRFVTPLLSAAVFLLFFQTSIAAYLGRPELTDYNFANATICTQSSIKIKFDYQSFGAGNVFTVQISNATGSFANPINMVGTLAMSGAQSNVFFTVTFPVGTVVTPGNGYRLRVKGTSPLTYSQQLNEYPFSLSSMGVSDPGFYPVNYWRGYFYTWNPSTPGIIADASGEDIFNPTHYIGYISEDSMSFDYDWGNNSPAPGLFPDSNRVCGNLIDKFAVRMRRRVTFQDGYYIFGGGADDGFRLSLDGGATWLINDWGDHTYRGTLQNNGCGVQMTAGVRDVVCEFYDHNIDAHFRCVIIKTGDPAINPISITNPASGSTICSGADPFQMTANPPGGWQWTGTGVSSNGILNPAIGGMGPRTITYQTGYNAFGQNCVKTTSISVNVSPGVSAQFSGLLPSYCVNGPASTLVPQNTGGAFSGTGVSGNAFSPQSAGPGTHSIRYIIGGAGTCTDTVDHTTTVYALPDATFQDLPDSVCIGSGNLLLNPVVPGGSFAGQGVILPNQFSPALLIPSNQYEIEYKITQNGCSARSTQFVYILEKLKKPITFSSINPRYCVSSPAFVPVTDPPSLINGFQSLTITPSMLGPGTYELKAIFQPNTQLSCYDSSSAKYTFTIIADPKPELGPDRETEAGKAITLDPQILPPYTWTADTGVNALVPDVPLTFTPASTVVVHIQATDPTQTCFGVDSVTVFVRPPLEIPNLFTPNGDGSNQEWRIKGAYPNMEVQIFDRWGKKIYSGTTVGDLAWSGNGGSKSGTYYYLLKNPADGRTWSGWISTAE